MLLASALVESPRLIVADEPTPGLDLDLAVRALDDLRAFADAGGGVLLITHDIELALRVADRIAVFKDGTVIEETAVESFNDPSQLRHRFRANCGVRFPAMDFRCPRKRLSRCPLGDARLNARRAAPWFGDGWLAAFVDNAAHGEAMRRRGWYAEGNAKDARGEGHFVCV